MLASLEGGDLLGPSVRTEVKLTLSVVAIDFVLEREVGELVDLFLTISGAELHVATDVVVQLVDSAAVFWGVSQVAGIVIADETGRGCRIVVSLFCIAQPIVIELSNAHLF